MKPRQNDRKCIATGEALAADDLAIRFVRGPAAELVPDLSEKLPGRGAWIRADRPLMTKAIEKGAFSRSFKGPAGLPQGMELASFLDQLDLALLQRALSAIGLARRAGQAVLGFDTVRREAAQLIGYVTPVDAAEDGVRKINQVVEAVGKGSHIALSVESDVLSQALGDMGVVHVGLMPGKAGQKAWAEIQRWHAFQGVNSV